MTGGRTRLAPSPTGALHLGNARTFLINWALARQQGWTIVLRIDDLDGPRIKAQAAHDAIETLRWLGMTWDEGPYFQSHDLAPYQTALQKLIGDGSAYPCRCTRGEIHATSLSAPHADQHESRYPGTCRPVPGQSVDKAAGPSFGWRLIVPEGSVDVEDEFAPRRAVDVQAEVGDFLIYTKGGLPSYQLAVVVDDARQGIDRIVRGDDLQTSVQRQCLIRDRLGMSPRPAYWHLPLVRGIDGQRLAKRHGDTRISFYRSLGVSPDSIRGLL
ncbi:MAG TPA: tRNA glutamyl-Q(34) synthetase GluQRS, partial [Pirellulaceae bacterium]